MATVYSVSQITRQVRVLLEENFGLVWVEGEVSNYRRQSSGHHYFTLKDDRAQLSCVMFARARTLTAPPALADGLCVQAFGELTVYEMRGQYQLVVDLVQTKGVGALQAKFEALKQRLQAEGLFDSARKRPLPKFPTRIAVVTSPTGAAIQDMLKILERRSPWLRVLIHPVRVQGAGAALEIAEAIRHISERAGDLGIQALIVGRGGGSFEDLWEFNEEALARAIHACSVPVISAVGHEIDFTIADFVADVRAPTPSAAAEIVAPEINALASHLQRLRASLDRAAKGTVEVRRLHLRQQTVSVFLREPQRVLHERQQRLDQLDARVAAVPARTLERFGQRLAHLHSLAQAVRPDQQIELRRRDHQHLASRLALAAGARLLAQRERLLGAIGHLRLLSPRQTLARGYSITRDEHGRAIHDASQVRPGEILRTQVSNGEVISTVRETRVA
ncbi:MAG: exodeoxyribonuclease VII large subunit [Verrucomicrobia bacterium]|nr:exodeoxyribonuclease VII large subunit [Verrucomicrobiota bacterium]